MYFCVCVCVRARLFRSFFSYFCRPSCFLRKKRRKLSHEKIIYIILSFIFIVVVVVVVTFVSPQSRSFSLLDAEKKGPSSPFRRRRRTPPRLRPKNSRRSEAKRETLSVLLCGFLSRHHRFKTAAQTKNHTRIVLS